MYALDQVAEDAAGFQAAVNDGQPYRPLYVKIKLVWTCNLRCQMCNHWRWAEPSPLPLDRWLAIVDELADLGCRKIHLTGGEPLLYPAIEQLIAHITARGLRANLTSNGTLISRERSRALASAGLRAANISIDSPERKLHDEIRGVQGSWKRAVKGVRFLARRFAGKKGLVRLNTVVGRRNYESLVDLPDFAASLGAAGINLIPLDDHTGELARLSKRQIRHYNAVVGPRIAARGLALGLLRDEAEAYPFGRDRPAINHSREGAYARGHYERFPCYAPWTHALIDHLGQVRVCCMQRNGPVLGDLRRQSFAGLWHGAPYAALRRPGVQPLFSACHRCDDFLEENRRLHQVALGALAVRAPGRGAGPIAPDGPGGTCAD